MIVARVMKSGCIIKGSCKIAGYDGEEGWFPAASFNFDFTGKKENGGKKSGGGGVAVPAVSARATATAAAAAGGGPQQPPEKDEAFSAMQLTKELDTATCYLMFLAMDERKNKKGLQEKCTADVHVLSSVQVNQVRHIFTSVMIHLGGVIVEKWAINGSGDEPPSESLTLKYDQAAMQFRKTDGMVYGPRHWDQVANGPWEEFTPSMFGSS